MAETSIQWCDHSINPLRARHKSTGRVGHYCEKISSGCKFCYSSRMQTRFGTPEFGGGQLLDEYELYLDESKLDEVRRRKKPTRYFWCDMTDMFGSWVKPEWLSACFATMDATPQHTHMLLTKRPENVRSMWPWPSFENPVSKHRPNVWIGTSVSDQATADKWIPELLKLRDLTPVLFVSAEPLIGPVKISKWFGPQNEGQWLNTVECGHPRSNYGVNLVIVGGESGANARPCNVEWIRSIVKQCGEAGTACFVKQLGSKPMRPVGGSNGSEVDGIPRGFMRMGRIKDSKGGVMAEWPEDLRVRQMPE